MSLDTLKAPEPFFFSTITPLDFKVHMVAIKDIGEALAAQLTKPSVPNTKPQILELHGPEPYTPYDVQKAFSRALNKNVAVKPVERQELAAFYANVFPPQIVDEWVEMATSFLPGGIAEKDVNKPTDAEVVQGKTTLFEGLEAAVSEFKE